LAEAFVRCPTYARAVELHMLLEAGTHASRTVYNLYVVFCI